MGFIKGIFNTLLDPKIFLTLAVVGLFAAIWKREKVASNAFGYGSLGLLFLFFVFGTFVGEGALLRFYVLHCVGFPLAIAVLMAVHFWRVRKDGGISGPL